MVTKLLKLSSSRNHLRLLLTIGFLFFACSSLVASEADLNITIAIIADPHLGVNTPDRPPKAFTLSLSLLSEAINRVNNRPDIDAVLFPGDLLKDAEPGNLSKLKQLLGRLSKPYFMAIGNHDFYDNRKGKLTKQQFMDAFPKGGFKGGRSYYLAQLCDQLNLIVLDTNISGRADGILPSEQLQWLKKVLAGTSNTPAIIMAHHSLAFHHPDDKMRQWRIFSIRNMEQVQKEILASPNVIAVITGHHHLASVRVIDDLPFISVPSALVYPTAMALMRIYKDTIMYRTIKLGDDKTRNKSLEVLKCDILYLPSFPPPKLGWFEMLKRAVEGKESDNHFILKSRFRVAD